jgi:hypothetical protein
VGVMVGGPMMDGPSAAGASARTRPGVAPARELSDERRDHHRGPERHALALSPWLAAAPPFGWDAGTVVRGSKPPPQGQLARADLNGA